MLGYTLRRLGSAIPTIFIIITLTFFLIRLAPGGPFDLERPIDPLILENLKKAYNMDAPLWQQYLIYLGNLLHGDLGPSFTRRDFTVNDLFASGLPVSIMLGTLGLTLAAIIGTFLGTLAALKQNSAVDYFVVALATFGITTPNFVVAPLLSLLFGVILGWVPAGGWSSANITYWILPVLTLALPQVGVIARLVRGATIEALRANHVRTARAMACHRVWLWACMHCAPPCFQPSLSRPDGSRPAHRFGRGRDDFRHARHRSLFRAGRAQPRLHPRHGNRCCHFGLRRGVQPHCRPSLCMA